MEPVEVIVTALEMGAVQGVKATASLAVKDAYASLKTLIRKRLIGRKDGELVLTKHEESPVTWRSRLPSSWPQLGPTLTWIS
jgi:hypothetical protein